MPEDSVGLGDRTHPNGIVDKEYFRRPLCVERWLRNKAQLTRKKYLAYLVRFQILTGLAPEQLLQRCKSVESVEVQDLIDRTSLEFRPAIQFCYRVAIRSFLSHNGYSLPKTDLQYIPQRWHRGYKRDEIQKLFGYLRKRVHKLFVLMAAESGLRSHVIMELRYSHIKEDLESGTTPVAVRLEPRFYVGKKPAGYTFLGKGSVRLIRECLDRNIIGEKAESPLIPRSYWSVRTAIDRSKRELALDPSIQPCHGFRKYFENALDEANIDHEKKMIIEGHFAGTRAKHYTNRDVEQLRDVYGRAFPSIMLRVDALVQPRSANETYDARLASLEARLERQRVLEAKMTVLEDELDQLKLFRQQTQPWKDP